MVVLAKNLAWGTKNVADSSKLMKKANDKTICLQSIYPQCLCCKRLSLINVSEKVYVLVSS